MKNFPISLKLALGFGGVILLLLASGATAYYYISDNLVLFKEYRTLAKNSNRMGAAQADMLMVRMNMKNFLITGDEADVVGFDKYIKLAGDNIEAAHRELSDPAQLELVTNAEKLAQSYKREFFYVQALQEDQSTAVGVLNVNGPKVAQLLTDVMRSANEDGDIKAAYHAGLALRNFLLARLNVFKFLAENSQAAVQQVHAKMTDFDKEYQLMDKEIENPARRDAIQQAVEYKRAYMDAFDRSVEILQARNDIVSKKLDVWGPQMAKNLDEARRLGKEQQDRLGPQVQEHGVFAESLVGGLTVAATILGIIAATVITLLITRPLKKVSAFARGLSQGDFQQDLDVHQKDELGELAQSVRTLPEILNRLRGTLSETIERISVGHVRDRASTDDFNGEYAELVKDVNTLADSLGGFLDAVVSPIMTIDKNKNILYMNEAGAKLKGLSGKDAEGGKCSDFFQTGDCGTGKCACERAMKTVERVTAMTTARPGDEDLEISYTGSPIISRSGEVVGALEVVLDQTEVVRAQKQVVEVASRAEGIAYRMAGAAEELAAQVEQISKGSDIQRDRVGETAVAMEEMNATVFEVAQNASHASSDSGMARDRALEGASIVREAVESITEVHEAARELQSNMQQLGTQADSIGAVMSVISDIADQTNLLALNAAIEAARAGDAGRGFAVVADEVRKLAEKTMGATQEVATNIRSIQNAANTNIKSMNNAAETVEKATSLANESGEALNAIVELVTNSASQVEGIAAASEEQSATSEQINSAIEEVNRIANETAEGLSQSSRAVLEVAAMSTDLNRLIEDMQGRNGNEASSAQPMS